jgi:hypothetical protein
MDNSLQNGIIVQQKSILFLGAGVSIPVGLNTTDSFLQLIYQEYSRHNTGIFFG